MGEVEASPASEEKHAEQEIRPAEESVSWNQDVEVCLFHAMLGHKPVGVNRHFHMMCIRDKFSQNIGRQVPSKVIWDHLTTMYDMQALHESEILPFPNSEKSFVLPEEIIQEVREGKLVPEEDSKDGLKEETDLSTPHEEGSSSSVKAAEKPAVRDKERDGHRGSGEREAAEKRKRNRAAERVLGPNSNPSSPGWVKRRRT